MIENKRRDISKFYLIAAKYILAIIFLGSAGVFVYKSQGLAFREDLAANSSIHGGTTNDYMVQEGLLLLNTNQEYDYLLLGDSNSNHYVRGILHKGTKVKHSWYATCMSFPNSMGTRDGLYPTWKINCKNNFKLGIGSNQNIIIAQSWFKSDDNYFECTSNNCQLTGDYFVDLHYQLKDLLDIYGNGNKIYIIGELPKPENNKIMICLKSQRLLGIDFNCDIKFKPKYVAQKINFILTNVASLYENVFFIEPADAICKDGLCNSGQGEESIFMTDGGHLSGYGSEVMWSFLINKIDEFERIDLNSPLKAKE